MAIMDFFKKLLSGGEPPTPRPDSAAARSDSAMDGTAATAAAATPLTAAAPVAPMAAAAAAEAEAPVSDEPDTQPADSDTPLTS
jgi:hypothetical protein